MVALVGAGALARAMAGLLAAAGEPATLFARPHTAARLTQEGMLTLAGARPLEVPVRSGAEQPPGTLGVIDDPAQISPDDAVLFATKGPQLPEVVAAVASAWRPGPGGWVGGLQNGVVKDDVLTDAFGAERVVGVATVLGAWLRAGGETVVTAVSRTYLGEFDGGRDHTGGSERIDLVTAAFARAGLTYDVVPDIRQLLWMKCCNAIGAFGVTALTRLSSTVLMRHESAATAYLSLLSDAVDVATAEGITVADYPDLPMYRYLNAPASQTIAGMVAAARALPSGAPHSYPSMAQDIIASRQTEVEEVFGDLVRRADRRGLEVPRLRLVYQLIAATDATTRASTRH